MPNTNHSNQCPICKTYYLVGQKHSCKILLLLSLSLIMFVVGMGNGYALGACETNLSNNLTCQFSASETFTLGANYSCNAIASGFACINFTAHNIVLDCNGATIISNTTGRVINSNNYNNITVKNCIVGNAGAYGISVLNSKNSTIISNTVKTGNTSGIYLNVVTSNVVTNNTVYINSTDVVGSGIFLNWGNFNNITNNTIIGDNYSSIGIRVIQNSNNATIAYNQINYTDVCIRYQGSTYGQIVHNNCSNNTNNWDGYNTGVHIMEDYGYINSGYYSNFVNISNNVFDTFGTSAIVAQGGDNLYITNNIMKGIPFSERNKYEADDWNEYACAMVYSNVVKTYGQGQSAGSDSLSKIYNWSSRNITISNNLISNVQCYMYTSNITGLTHDLTNYYSWTFGGFTSKLLPFTFYIPSGITPQRWRAGNSGVNHQRWSFSQYNFSWFNWFGGEGEYNLKVNYTITPDKVYISGNNTNVQNATFICSPNCSIANTTGGTVKGVVNNVATQTLTVNSGESYVANNASSAGGCDYPYEDMSIITNTTLCYNSYSLLDSNLNGAILINANNVKLDCNGAFLNGFNVTNSIGINSSFNNTMIKNCVISNYTKAINSIGTSSSVKIQNNSFINNTIIQTKRGIYLQYADYFDIENNTFLGCDKSLTSAQITSGFSVMKGGLISNNYFDAQSTCDMAIRIANGNNGTQIINNNLKNVDRGIYVDSSQSIKIMSNTIDNATTNIDYYMVGIHIHDIQTDNRAYYFTNNISVINNNITNSGAGILVQGGNILNLSNNNIDILTINEKLTGNYQIDDSAEQPCGIKVVEIFKQALGDATESLSDTYAKIHNYSTSNVNIGNNIFSSKTECYLQTQGTVNLTSDIAGWYTKYNFRNDFMDDYTTYMSNGINEMNQYRSSLFYRPTNTLMFAYKAIYPFTYIQYNYSIAKSSMYFKNVNQSTSYNLSLYNLTSNGYLYNDIFCNSSLPNASDVTSWNHTFVAGERCFGFGYLTSTEPRYTGVDPTVTQLSIIAWNSISAALNCVGTGNLNISGFSNFDSANGYTDVYINSIYNTTLYGNNQTLPCLTGYTFKYSKFEAASPTVQATTNQVIQSLIIFASWFGIMVIIIVSGVLITGLLRGNIDLEHFKTYIIIMLITAVLLAIGVIILSAIFIQ